MKKIYSFLLVLLMAGLSIGSAQASTTIASGDGWKLCKITSDDAGMSKYVGKKILYITSDQASKSYSSASACPWSSYADQVDAAAFTLQYSGSKRIGAYMFANMVNLTEVQLNWSGNSSASTTYAIGAHAFEGCANLKELRSLGAKSIGDYAFKGCTNLEMVYAHPQLTSIGAHAFEECTSLQDFWFYFGGTIRFAVGNYAFCKCSSLKYFYGEYITSVGEYGFANCALTSIDLENCKTISERAFNKNKLSYVHFGSAITNIATKAFYDGLEDNGTVKINRSTPPTTASDAFSANNLSTITLDCPAGNAYNVAPWSSFKRSTLESKLYVVLDGTTLTLYYDGEYISRDGHWWNNTMWDLTASEMNSVTKVVIDPSVAAARPTTTANWFANYYINLKQIDGLEFLNTSEVTDMSRMFKYCPKLSFIDLRNFNTSSCTDMSSLFDGCAALLALDVNGFDMSNVTSAMFMFSGCTNLQRIFCEKDWSSLGRDVLYYAFNNCTSLGGGWGTPFDSNHIHHDYARPDGGSKAPGYFWSQGDSGEEEEEIIEPEDPVDTREVITTVALQGLNKSLFQAGASINDLIDEISLSPVDDDAPYFVSGISLMKFDEATSQYGYEGVGETLEEGTYRLSLAVIIDGDEAEWYRFPDSDEDLPTVTLDGQTCYDRFSYVSSSEKYSTVEFDSPEIYVSAQGIEDIQVNNVRSQKIVCDGILLILRNGKLYNAQGVEVK